MVGKRRVKAKILPTLWKTVWSMLPKLKEKMLKFLFVVFDVNSFSKIR